MIDETGLSGVIDFGVKDEYELNNLVTVRRALAQYGIDVIEGLRRIDILVIRDTPRFQSDLAIASTSLLYSAQSSGSAADAAWGALMAVFRRPSPNSTASIPVYYAWDEIQRREFRRRGMQFFELFPSDPRRWKWIPISLLNHPRYWKNLVEGGRAAATLLDTQGWLAA